MGKHGFCIERLWPGELSIALGHDALVKPAIEKVLVILFENLDAVKLDLARTAARGDGLQERPGLPTSNRAERGGKSSSCSVFAIDTIVSRELDARSVSTRGHDVRENCARVYRRELVAIPEQHQLRLGANRAQQAIHELEIDHRSLIDDHKLVREGVGLVVTKAASRG